MSLATPLYPSDAHLPRVNVERGSKVEEEERTSNDILLAAISKSDKECYSCCGGGSLRVCRKKYARILPAKRIAVRLTKQTNKKVSDTVLCL